MCIRDRPKSHRRKHPTEVAGRGIRLRSHGCLPSTPHPTLPHREPTGGTPHPTARCTGARGKSRTQQAIALVAVATSSPGQRRTGAHWRQRARTPHGRPAGGALRKGHGC
eukprot:10736-Alexandrium_andersonii.AAC.1